MHTEIVVNVKRTIHYIIPRTSLNKQIAIYKIAWFVNCQVENANINVIYFCVQWVVCRKYLFLFLINSASFVREEYE